MSLAETQLNRSFKTSLIMAINLNLDISEELNITVRRGDSLSFDVTVKDTDGDAVDLTNYNFIMDVRKGTSNKNRNDVVLSNRSGGKNTLLLTITGAADGTLSVSASKQATNQIVPASYNFDIAAIKKSDDTEQTWFYGTFTVNADYSVAIAPTLAKPSTQVLPTRRSY